MERKIVLVVILVVISATAFPVAGLLPTKAGITEQMKNINYGNTGASAADDIWPMYRYDPANTGCSPYLAPFTNHVKWKHNIGSSIYQSTPIVYGDKIYINTNWEYKDLSKSNEPQKKQSRIEFLQSLIEQQNGASPGVYCLDAKTGSQVWYHGMDAPADPAIVNGKMYLTDLNPSTYYSTLYCLDIETGGTLWQEPLGTLVLSPTISANNRLYLGCMDYNSYSGSLQCYDLNGSLKWNYALPGTEVIWFSAPAVSGGYVTFISSDMYSYYYSGHLYCLNALTGQFSWSHPVFSFGMLFYRTQSPACANGDVYVSDFNLDSYLSYLKCYDLATGTLHWTANMQQSFSLATPAISNDSVYVTATDLATYNSWLYRINLNGSVRWMALLYSAQSFFIGSPICSENKVYISPGSMYSNLNQLLCVDIEGGKLDWTYNLDYESLGEASFGDGTAYMVDYSGNVYAFEDVLKVQPVGGLFGVGALIKNTGNTSLSNINWTIFVTGGMLNMVDRVGNGTISEIQAGKSKTARLIPVIGLGKVKIFVYVSMKGMSPMKIVKQGLILGSVSIILP